MANKNLITYGFNLEQVMLDYFAPTATVAGQNISNMYCFLSGSLPWSDDNDPEQPRQDQNYIKNIFKYMFVAKKITNADVSPVIERHDWTNGQVYDYYRDDIDMFAIDINGFNVLKFYVRNRYDQVYKCLWNNNGGIATDEPVFQPGSYGTNNIYTGIDGYKWKYLYTISQQGKTKFMDVLWMPVEGTTTIPNAQQSSAGRGNIDVVGVINGGSGYDPINTLITLNIEGDGTGATANVITTGDAISDIYIRNPGSNYTYANVTLTSIAANGISYGSGATFYAAISPIGGHGFDSKSELGCRHFMITTEFNSNESIYGVQYIPTDIDYRQVGLLLNPKSKRNFPYVANASIYNIATQLYVSPGFGTYSPDEEVFQGSSGFALDKDKTFRGTVLSFDKTKNLLQVINTSGSYTTGSQVYSTKSKTTRTLLGATESDLYKFSGNIIYIENRSPVVRSDDGIEQFKFVLGY
jgi:hypothetical protein